MDLGASGERPGEAGTTTVGRSRVGTDSLGQPCVYHAEPRREFSVYEDGFLLDFHDTPPTPEHKLYELRCNAELVGLRWYGPGTPTPDLAAQLEQLLDRLDVHDATIDLRPDSAGLVGLPAYAWLSDGAVGPLTASVTLPVFGTTVVVVARLTAVTWDFGDGTPPVAGGPGEPWPALSSVHHAYADPSPTDDPYRVAATLTYTPSYTVDGVPGAALDTITVTLERTYAVRELQAVRQR